MSSVIVLAIVCVVVCLGALAGTAACLSAQRGLSLRAERKDASLREKEHTHAL